MSSHTQVHQTAALGFVFVHWAVVDLIRYPFYLLNMVRACPPLLKWMRYSEFIVMYPISFTSESTAPPATAIVIHC